MTRWLGIAYMPTVLRAGPVQDLDWLERLDNNSEPQKKCLECVDLAIDICTVTYYKNRIVKESQRSQMDQLSILGAKA